MVCSPHEAALALADRGAEDVLNVVTVAFRCCLLIPLAKVLADAFGQGSGSHLCPMLLITQPAALLSAAVRKDAPIQSPAVHALLQPLAIAGGGSSFLGGRQEWRSGFGNFSGLIKGTQAT